MKDETLRRGLKEIYIHGDDKQAQFGQVPIKLCF